MTAFEPVRTLAELGALDADQIVAGYLEYRPDDPEPGPNRGKAYWHGWRNAGIDRGRIAPDDASSQLAHEAIATGYLARLGSSGDAR
jgi:hypothetical protein